MDGGVGDTIEPGMQLAEVETDKIVNVMEATFSGVLLKKVADEGDVLPVSALLGVIGDGSTTEADIEAFIANLVPKHLLRRRPAMLLPLLQLRAECMRSPCRSGDSAWKKEPW